MSSASKRRRQAAIPAAPESAWGGVFLTAWRPYAWIVIAGFALYCRAIFFNFTYLDDNALILDNYHHLRDLASLLQAFRHDVFFSHGAGAFYRPILTLSLGLDAQLGGLSPWVYHLDSIIVHLIAASLVFRLLARLGYSRGQALFAALLFDVHPVISQAVAWVPGRNDSLAGVFVLLSFLKFVDFLERRADAGGWKIYPAHLFFFALALFTKETSAALSLVCLAYAFLIVKSRPPGSVFACAAGWCAVLATWFLMRRAALENPLQMGILDMTRSIWLNLPALLQNFGKVLLPFNLSVLPTLHDTTFGYGAAAASAMVICVAMTKQKRWRHMAFGFCWFAAFLLPSFILHSTTVADFILEHRNYLPIIGLLVVFLETGAARNWSGKAAAAWGVLVLLFFSAITWNHIENFKDRLSFWADAARTSPHLPLAHRNLGAMYYLDGRLGPAEAEYKAAIALNASEPMVHTNLGLLYMNRGQVQEAEPELRLEIAVNPRYENGYFNLGVLYYKRGRLEEARALWEKALEINPEHMDANADLAIYYRQRDPGKAIFYLERLKALNESMYRRVAAAFAQQP